MLLKILYLLYLFNIMEAIDKYYKSLFYCPLGENSIATECFVRHLFKYQMRSMIQKSKHVYQMITAESEVTYYYKCPII